MTYLLRLVLPDRPGMLGAVATALGEVGGDIVSLDVVERGPEGAVDDLLVQLPAGGLADVLITSARSVPGVIVESLRPYPGADDLHRDLELVDELAAAPASALQLLVDLAPGVFRAGWASLFDSRNGVVSASACAPDLGGMALPGCRSSRLDGWTARSPGSPNAGTPSAPSWSPLPSAHPTGWCSWGARAVRASRTPDMGAG